MPRMKNFRTNVPYLLSPDFASSMLVAWPLVRILHLDTLLLPRPATTATTTTTATAATTKTNTHQCLTHLVIPQVTSSFLSSWRCPAVKRVDFGKSDAPLSHVLNFLHHSPRIRQLGLSGSTDATSSSSVPLSSSSLSSSLRLHSLTRLALDDATIVDQSVVEAILSASPNLHKMYCRNVSAPLLFAIIRHIHDLPHEFHGWYRSFRLEKMAFSDFREVTWFAAREIPGLLDTITHDHGQVGEDYLKKLQSQEPIWHQCRCRRCMAPV